MFWVCARSKIGQIQHSETLAVSAQCFWDEMVREHWDTKTQSTGGDENSSASEECFLQCKHILSGGCFGLVYGL